jgi:hypothetical protein
MGLAPSVALPHESRAEAMRMTRLLILATLLATGSLMACNQKSEGAQVSHEHGAECSCNRGKQGETVWCDKCQVGCVKGEKTRDKAAVTAAMSQ